MRIVGLKADLQLIAWALLTGMSMNTHAAPNPPQTVGSVTESNGLRFDGFLRVRTPSILRVEIGELVQGDARAAITQYDALLALPPESIDTATRAESLRRASDLRVQLADADSANPEGFHVGDVRRAIQDYQRVLKDHPGYALNDRVYYQLARAHALLGEPEPAIAALTQLGLRYPQSARAADAYFRSGEMLFARSRFREAEAAYAGLLALGTDAPYYELAQYKYGWSLYKQSLHERAAEVFLAVLDRDLPSGTLEDPAAAMAAVARDKQERAQDALRVTAMSFAALGGGPAVNAHFARAPKASRMETLIYSALGEALLEKERYTDAAGTYLAFITRHPDHVRAPDFQMRAIAAYGRGGFAAQAIQAQETYATRYAPDSAYWSARTPDTAVMTQVRQYLDELGRYHQAGAQQTAALPARQAAYLKAASWYRRTLDLFPQDERITDTSLLLADALLEGGRVQDAAQQYAFTAYDTPAHARAPVAALASVQAWQRLVREQDGQPAQADARRASISASLKLADAFAAHPQRTQVLMAAAEDQYALGELDAAVATAERVMQAQATPLLRRGALGIIADARFAQKRFPEAEAAYTELVKLPAASAGAQSLAIEQLAASVYKQAEGARDSGDLSQAATHFQRVAQLAPGASIRAAADYDAASTLIVLEDWSASAQALEAFRARFPQHRLAADADKKLALAYDKSGQPALAAAAFSRISQRSGETLETQRKAAWTAAQLFEQARQPAQVLRSYTDYVTRFPQPLDPAMQARKRLSELALSEQQNPATHRYWLEQIVIADQSAGAARSETSRRYAAEASLGIGRAEAAQAHQLALRLPLDQTLARKKAATESSVRTLERAAAYGYADITSAATFELATVYANFGRALMQSERPTALAGEALQQYAILLEEQAFPFEEKAIQAHEINLQRMRKGIWNEAIAKSVTALGNLSPAKYGKQEQREAYYDELH